MELSIDQALTLQLAPEARVLLAYSLVNDLTVVNCPSVRIQLGLTFAQLELAVTCLKVAGHFVKIDANNYQCRTTKLVDKSDTPTELSNNKPSKKAK